MSIPTTTPYRRVVGTIIRGVGDGRTTPMRGVPLAGATVVITAPVLTARSDGLIVLDPVDACTDHNAVLRSAVGTGEVGVPLLVTDDLSLGVVGWTYTATISAPTLARPIVVELAVPAGSGDLDLKDAVQAGIRTGVSLDMYVIEVPTEADIPEGFVGLWLTPAGDLYPVS